MSARTWCYTVNNYSDAECENIQRIECNLHVCGKEVGKDGTPHLQGVITFKKPIRLTGCKELIPRAHWEICRSRDAAIKYCSKDNDMLVNETANKQGTRTDLLDAISCMQERGINATALEHPEVYIKYYKGLEAYANQVVRNVPEYKLEKIVDKLVTTYVFWGAPESGKTRAIKEFDPHAYFVEKARQKDTDPWFTGYENNKTIVFDDFYGWVSYSRMLRLLDRYTMTLETKGGTTYKNWDTVIITSNTPPEEWYPNLTDVQRRAFFRRIKEVRHYESDGSVTVTEVACNTKEATSDTLLNLVDEL